MTKLIYLDTETTGLNPETCAITQLSGVIRVGDSTQEFDIFMRPHEGAEISQEALETQGRTLEEINAFPDPKEGYQRFVDYLGQHVDKFNKTDKFFLFGFNIQFDANIMRAWFKRNGDNYFGSWFWNPPIDVMSIAAMALMDRRPSLPNFKLSTVYKALYPEDTEITFHNSKDDIKATRRILRDIRIGWVKKEEATNAPRKN